MNRLKDYKKFKNMKFSELEDLSCALREFLISTVSKTGGHLSSNLGVVELTIALHKSFNFPQDKLIFDVGHQSYIHKILTGRIDEFSDLRQFGGLSGFPKVTESEFDVFNSGHSSNSISVSLGIKRAFDNKGDTSKVIAFIGDGALTGGMAYEALNDAGRAKSNIIIVLNDNEMSITQNVGSMAKHLAKIRTNPLYLRTKGTMTMFLLKIPFWGKGLYKIISYIKSLFKNLFVQKNIFEELGFYYAGPFDGHNIKEMCKAFGRIKHLEKPIVVHIATKKGKGCKFAEENPEEFHGVKKFDVKTGRVDASAVGFSDVFGDELVRLAKGNDKIVAITAAMPQGTGLVGFKNNFKDRYYDVGIAEGHGVSMAAGLAIGGMIPVFAVYSSFLQRGYDQLVVDVCAMNLHCIFGVDRAGIVGEDGETHQGIFDISYLTSIPNITVFSPATNKDLRIMLGEAVYDYHSPCAIRYPRGSEDKKVLEYEKEYVKGMAQILIEGTDVSIICEGRMVGECLKAAELLKEKGIFAEVINIRYIKPLDCETIENSINKTKKAIVVENNTIYGGVFSQIKGLTNEKVISVSVPDKFVEQGSVDELFKLLKMDSVSIAQKAIDEFFPKKRGNYEN
jgi:1-deoxy-D-xylulose-5-phosphate synthase